MNKIKNRRKGESELAPFMKKGMTLPCPIKYPLEFYREHSEVNCNPPI